MTRAVFFDEEDARAVARRLERDGFRVTVRREPFAGEDDDEDHPWAVVSLDAPPVMLELLVEQHDGWLEQHAPAPSVPLDLPTGPRRLKREP